MASDEKLDRKGHEGREDLIGEHRWGDAGQMILLIVFLILWVVDSFVMHYSTFLTAYIPLYVRLPLGIIILAGAFLLARAGLNVVFGEIREKPTVIKKGVFGVIRHPVYLGAILLYPGLFIATLSVISMANWLLIIMFYHMIARYEESLLLEELGDDYAQYKRDVPMWIPRLMKRN